MRDVSALIPAHTDLTLAPRWQTALAAQLEPIMATRPRSWDLWGDVVSPAYDTVRDDVNEVIAVTCAFVGYLADTDLDDAERKLVAVGIRTWGKSFAWGLAQAIGACENFEMRAWFRYARAVARRVNEEHRP